MKPCLICNKNYAPYPKQTHPICETCQADENDYVLRQIKHQNDLFKMTLDALSL